MPICSKCNAVQSRLNKGALCKKCFNNKINVIENVATTNDDDIENSLIDDRSLIDMIKSQMAKEIQWNIEMTQIFKEQIEHLKGEIKQKNFIINHLIKNNHCKQSILNSNNTNVNQGDASSKRNQSSTSNNNDQFIISPDDASDGVLISIDSSLNSTDGVYNNIERDDINPQDDWIRVNDNNNNKIHNNNKEHNYVNIEHPNRYESLRVNTDNTYNERNYKDHDNVNKEYIRNDKNNTSQHHTYETQPNLRTRPHVVIQDYPEKNYIPIKPGINNYNQALKDGKTTVIFSTSITKGIKVRDFNNEYKLGTARFRRFHGASSKYMKHYVIPTLIDECPQVVLLQCGGNGLPTSKSNPKPVEDIAKEIIDTAKLCENYGVQQILIGSVITRKQGYMDRRKRELNRILKGMCTDLGYFYVDNENITHEHLCRDDVHLTYEGSDILTLNYLHSLNNIF